MAGVVPVMLARPSVLIAGLAVTVARVTGLLAARREPAVAAVGQWARPRALVV